MEENIVLGKETKLRGMQAQKKGWKVFTCSRCV